MTTPVAPAQILQTGSAAPTFVDQFGQRHRLIPGYRSRIKPGWEAMLGNAPLHRPRNGVARRFEEVHARVQLGVHLLEVMNCPPAGKDILVVGCDEGDEVAYLAAAGAASVTGSNHDSQKGPEPARRLGRPNVLDETCPIHAPLIEHLRLLGGLPSYRQCRKSIADDNVEASSLPDASFDVVCSWRTLEHLTSPEAAFAEMFRIIRPGGTLFHEYNPFFCIDGGHSLVTLDFPWGHVLLGADELERYLDTFRPAEKTLAMQFYHANLNRMSIAQMESFARAAGFEVEALIPRARTEDLLEITVDLLRAAQRTYPYVTLNDLVSRVVRVVLRRP